MEYFFNHIVVIIIAAVVIAAIAFAMVLFAEKNEAQRDINEERCDGMCQACGYFQACHKPEKKRSQETDK